MKDLNIEIRFSPRHLLWDDPKYVYPDQFIPSCSGNLGPKPDGEDYIFFSMGATLMERDRGYYEIFDTYEAAYQHVQEFIKECEANFAKLWADYNSSTK